MGASSVAGSSASTSPVLYVITTTHQFSPTSGCPYFRSCVQECGQEDPQFDGLYSHNLLAPVTGCIEGFFEAENCKENAVESINTISLFCTLKKCN